MKKFLLGFAVGIFLTACIYFSPYADPRFRIKVGRLLDEDIIYLKNGSVVHGWIVNETKGEILVDFEKGTFSLTPSECKSIKRNYLLKYIRELT